MYRIIDTFFTDRKKIAAVVFALLTLPLSAELYPSYDAELMNEFDMGTEESDFGYNKLIDPMDEPGPSGIGVDDRGYLYICDTWKNRIAVLGQDFEIAGIIRLSGIEMLGYSRQLIISNDTITGYRGDLRFFKAQIISDAEDEQLSLNDEPPSWGTRNPETGPVEASAKKIFSFSLSESQWVKRIDRYNFILIENNLFYYLKDKSIVLFPNLQGDRYADSMNHLENAMVEYLFTDGKAVEKEQYGLAGLFLKENVLIRNDEVQTRDFGTYIKYWQNENAPVRLNAQVLPGLELERFKNMLLLGKDEDRNVYWKTQGDMILVFSRRGILIEAFGYDIPSSYLGISLAVHPSGDVYFFSYNAGTASLHRIRRVW